MGRPGTRKTRNPKNVKIRYAEFTEGLVTERQYLELLYQQIRPKHATIKIHGSIPPLLVQIALHAFSHLVIHSSVRM